MNEIQFLPTVDSVAFLGSFLPAAEPEAATPQDVAEPRCPRGSRLTRHRPAVATQSSARLPARVPARVLIAEPDIEARTLLKYTLRHAGFDPRECPRPIDLWVLLSAPDAGQSLAHFDFLICNQEMVNEQVLNVVEELKYRGTCPPLILVARTFDARTRQTVSHLQPAAVFDDPFDARRQLAAIHTTLQRLA